MIAEGDTNHDGVVDFQEFNALMLAAPKIWFIGSYKYLLSLISNTLKFNTYLWSTIKINKLKMKVCTEWSFEYLINSVWPADCIGDKDYGFWFPLTLQENENQTNFECEHYFHLNIWLIDEDCYRLVI